MMSMMNPMGMMGSSACTDVAGEGLGPPWISSHVCRWHGRWNEQADAQDGLQNSLNIPHFDGPV